MEQNKEYNMIFTAADLNIIMAGLQELPFKISAMVINKINHQAVKQNEEPVVE